MALLHQSRNDNLKSLTMVSGLFRRGKFLAYATQLSLPLFTCTLLLCSVDSNRFKSCRRLMLPPIILRTKVCHNHCNLLPNLKLKRGAVKVTPLQPSRVGISFRTFLHLLSYEMTASRHYWWTEGFSFQSMKTLLSKMLRRMHHCRRLEGDFYLECHPRWILVCHPTFLHQTTVTWGWGLIWSGQGLAREHLIVQSCLGLSFGIPVVYCCVKV